MNKDLAAILANRLAGLAFLQIIAGMVQTVTVSEMTDGAPSVLRYPVATDTNFAQGCRTGNERELIPDSSKYSMLYFEDFGTSPGPTRGRFQSWVSSLRLVCWWNSAKLPSGTAANNTEMIAAIIARLRTQAPQNAGPFLRLQVNASRLPIMDAGIFSRYTYKEEERQYLRPPFDFFAIDLNATFELNGIC